MINRNKCIIFAEIKTMKELININEVIPTKANIVPVAKSLSDAVKDGNMNPLEFAVKIKFIQECLTAAYKECTEEIIKEIGKETTYMGAKLEVAETGTKYDYSGDSTWCEISDQIKPLNDLLKAQEERIKMATKAGAIMCSDDGVVIAEPVIKTSTTSPKITLGKW